MTSCWKWRSGIMSWWVRWRCCVMTLRVSWRRWQTSLSSCNLSRHDCRSEPSKSMRCVRCSRNKNSSLTRAMNEPGRHSVSWMRWSKIAPNPSSTTSECCSKKMRCFRVSWMNVLPSTPPSVNARQMTSTMPTSRSWRRRWKKHSRPWHSLRRSTMWKCVSVSSCVTCWVIKRCPTSSFSKEWRWVMTSMSWIVAKSRFFRPCNGQKRSSDGVVICLAKVRW